MLGGWFGAASHGCTVLLVEGYLVFSNQEIMDRMDVKVISLHTHLSHVAIPFNVIVVAVLAR